MGTATSCGGTVRDYCKFVFSTDADLEDRADEAITELKAKARRCRAKLSAIRTNLSTLVPTDSASKEKYIRLRKEEKHFETELKGHMDGLEDLAKLDRAHGKKIDMDRAKEALVVRTELLKRDGVTPEAIAKASDALHAQRDNVAAIGEVLLDVNSSNDRRVLDAETRKLSEEFDSMRRDTILATSVSGMQVPAHAVSIINQQSGPDGTLGTYTVQPDERRKVGMNDAMADSVAYSGADFLAELTGVTPVSTQLL